MLNLYKNCIYYKWNIATLVNDSFIREITTQT